jgi:hypothetical protein
MLASFAHCTPSEWRHEQPHFFLSKADRKMPQARLHSRQFPTAEVLLTFVDQFSGFGGFSLGLDLARVRCHAAIDFNESAIETFRRNYPDVLVTR